MLSFIVKACNNKQYTNVLQTAVKFLFIDQSH